MANEDNARFRRQALWAYALIGAVALVAALVVIAVDLFDNLALDLAVGLTLIALALLCLRVCARLRSFKVGED